MTRPTNARIAGVTLLLYIVVGVSQLTVFGGVTAGQGTAARLATMAARATDVQVNVVLTLVTSFVAFTLGVALYSLTREQDADLALLALVCRIAEGVVGASSIVMTLALLSLATAAADGGPDAAAAHSAGALVLRVRPWIPVVGASFFAVGSGLFCWLLLRGRMIPAALAWTGLIASVVLVAGLPLQLGGVLRGPASQLMWIPMALFEIPAGVWLIAKGVRSSAPVLPA